MAAAAGILNPQAAAQALTSSAPKPMSSTTTGTNTTGTNTSSSASSTAATITANDFLTLLVTEMQNQDPTATTDPNEYINQLVQVNSLEQLIGINQTLTGALGGSPANAGSSATGQAASANSLLSNPHSTDGTKTAQVSTASHVANHTAMPAPHFAAVPGNLGIPAANQAAARVASALDGSGGPSPGMVGIAGAR